MLVADTPYLIAKHVFILPVVTILTSLYEGLCWLFTSEEGEKQQEEAELLQEVVVELPASDEHQTDTNPTFAGKTLDPTSAPSSPLESKDGEDAESERTLSSRTSVAHEVCVAK